MKENRNIWIMYAIALLQGMVFYAPVATLYRQAAGLGIFQISLIEGISLGLTIVLELPWGYAADRIGYRKTMLLCCGLFFVSKLVFWQAEGFGGFLLERILLSVVIAGLSGVDATVLYLSCKEGESHRVFSIYQNLGEAGMVLSAAVFALFLGERYRLAALLTAVSYGIAGVLAFCMTEVYPREARERRRKDGLKETVRAQLTNGRNLKLLLCAALLGETHQMVTVFLSQLQYTRAGMSASAISWSFIGVCLAGLFGGFSADLTARLGRRRTGSVLILTGAAACFMMALTKNALLSVAAVIALRGCNSLFSPLCAEIENRLVCSPDRATALSVNAVVGDGLSIGLNLIFGWAAEGSLPWALAFGGGMCLVSLLSFWSVQSREQT